MGAIKDQQKGSGNALRSKNTKLSGTNTKSKVRNKRGTGRRYKTRSSQNVVVDTSSSERELSSSPPPKKMKVLDSGSAILDEASSSSSIVPVMMEENASTSDSLTITMIPANVEETVETPPTTNAIAVPQPLPTCSKLVPLDTTATIMSVANFDSSAAVLSPMEIVNEIEDLLSKSRKRPTKDGEVYEFDWHVIFQCLINMMNDGNFKVENWQDLFKEKTHNTGNRSKKTPSIFMVMYKYVELTNEKAKVAQLAAEKYGGNENSCIRERYARPVFTKIKKTLRDLMCTVMVKLFDCLFNPAVDGTKYKDERAEKLGQYIIDGYNNFKSQLDPTSSIWKQRISLPREQRKRFIYANHLEDPQFQIAGAASDNEEDIVPNPLPISQCDESSAMMAHELEKLDANEKLEYSKQQYQLAVDELKRLEELMENAEARRSLLAKQVAEQTEVHKRANTNVKIVKALSLEKDDDKRFWMAKVGVKMTQNCSIDVLQRLADQDVINFDLRTLMKQPLPNPLQIEENVPEARSLQSTENELESSPLQSTDSVPEAGILQPTDNVPETGSIQSTENVPEAGPNPPTKDVVASEMCGVEPPVSHHEYVGENSVDDTMTNLESGNGQNVVCETENDGNGSSTNENEVTESGNEPMKHPSSEQEVEPEVREQVQDKQQVDTNSMAEVPINEEE